MLKVPEYHWLCGEPGTRTLRLSAVIDGEERRVPAIKADATAIGWLMAAFNAGQVSFMSFDEHPKTLVSVERLRGGIRITARSITPEDQFPDDWEPSPIPIAG